MMPPLATPPPPLLPPRPLRLPPQECQRTIADNVRSASPHVFQATAYPQALRAGVAQQKLALLAEQLGALRAALDGRGGGGGGRGGGGGLGGGGGERPMDVDAG